MGTALHKTLDLDDAVKGGPPQAEAIHFEWRPGLDRPWRRFAVAVPASMAASALLLIGFSLVLRPRMFAPEHREAIEARLIEIQPAGLQGDNRPKVAPQPIPPAPRAAKPRPHMRPQIAVPVMAPPVVSSAPSSGITIPSGVLHPEAAPADAGGSGEGGGGIGSDTTGARAIYAPKPSIPDDLRENVFQAEAVARFTVAADGTAEVVLEKPTSNPRLNQVLLDTLKEWKFFPAVKGGLAVASTFEIRIPITVR